jgi:hypothetical protein
MMAVTTVSALVQCGPSSAPGAGPREHVEAGPLRELMLTAPLLVTFASATDRSGLTDSQEGVRGLAF